MASKVEEQLLTAIAALTASVSEIKEQGQRHYDDLVGQNQALSERLDIIEQSAESSAYADSKSDELRDTQQTKTGKSKSRRVSFGAKSYSQLEHQDYANNDGGEGFEDEDNHPEAFMDSVDDINALREDASKDKIQYVSTLKGVLITVVDHKGKDADHDLYLKKLTRGLELNLCGPITDESEIKWREYCTRNPETAKEMSKVLIGVLEKTLIKGTVYDKYNQSIVDNRYDGRAAYLAVRDAYQASSSNVTAAFAKDKIKAMVWPTEDGDFAAFMAQFKSKCSSQG